MAICVSWGHYGTPILAEGRRGSATAPFETAMVVSYRLSIVTVAPGLFVTIWIWIIIANLLTDISAMAICVRMSLTLKSTGGCFGPKFPGVPLVVDP